MAFFVFVDNVERQGERGRNASAPQEGGGEATASRPPRGRAGVSLREKLGPDAAAGVVQNLTRREAMAGLAGR